MKAPRERIDLWIRVARNTNSEFILSVADMFRHKYDPVFCKDKAELIQKHKKYEHNDDSMVSEIIRVTCDTAFEGLTLFDIIK